MKPIPSLISELDQQEQYKAIGSAQIELICLCVERGVPPGLVISACVEAIAFTCGKTVKQGEADELYERLCQLLRMGLEGAQS